MDVPTLVLVFLSNMSPSKMLHMKPCYDAMFICAPKYFILLRKFQDINIQNLKLECLVVCYGGKVFIKDSSFDIKETNQQDFDLRF